MENFETKDANHEANNKGITSTESLNESIDNPLIISATEKIMSKCLENNATDKKLRQEVGEDGKVGNYIDKVQKEHPELWFFLASDLGMGRLVGRKYDALAPTEKMRLVALYNTLNNGFYETFGSYTDADDKVDIKEFKLAYREQYKGVMERFSTKFELAQLKNGLDTKKTLKEEYSLTDDEANEYIIYLEKLKNQPDPVLEAGGGKFAILIIGMVIGFALGLFGKAYFESLFNPEPSTVIQTGRVQFYGLKDIAQLFTVEEEFNTIGALKKEQWKRNEENGRLVDVLKRAGNVCQSSEILIQLKGKYAIQFDLDHSIFEYDYDEKKIYAHLTSPKIVITDSDPKVLQRNSEIFETKSFDNIQMELVDSLENNVILAASQQPEIYARAKRNAEQIIGVIYGDAFRIAKIPFNGVVVTTDLVVLPETNIEPEGGEQGGEKGK